MFDRSLEGRRVRLVSTFDPFTDLHAGDLGTVQFTDDAGTLAVRWDSGSTLGLIAGEDQWVLLPEGESK